MLGLFVLGGEGAAGKEDPGRSLDSETMVCSLVLKVWGFDTGGVQPLSNLMEPAAAQGDPRSPLQLQCFPPGLVGSIATAGGCRGPLALLPGLCQDV